MQRRLQTIDALRGIAALAVLLGHIRHHRSVVSIDLRFWLLFPLDFGYLGVALFLVISGFCIHLRTARRFVQTSDLRADWKVFWGRRFYRLYPPYLVAIVVSIIAYYAATPAARAPWQHIDSLAPDLLTHLGMVHNLFRSYTGGLGNSSFWTLGLEEQLYALYALYLLLRRRFSFVQTLVGIASVTLLWRGAVYIHHSFPANATEPSGVFMWDDWPVGYWFLWVLGAAAAEAYAGAVHLPAWCYRYWTAGTLAVGAFVVNPLVLSRLTSSHYLTTKLGADNAGLKFINSLSILSDPMFATAFCVVLLAWVRNEQAEQPSPRVVRWLSVVGTFSYSLYLTHIPVLVLGETVLPTGDSLGSLLFRYLFYVPAALVVAVAFFWLVERRFLHLPSAVQRHLEKPRQSIGV